ncbi:hypothetical protein JCM17478_02580 [Thermopirellula anaerolimosa]
MTIPQLSRLARHYCAFWEIAVPKAYRIEGALAKTYPRDSGREMLARRAPLNLIRTESLIRLSEDKVAGDTITDKPQHRSLPPSFAAILAGGSATGTKPSRRIARNVNFSTHPIGNRKRFFGPNSPYSVSYIMEEPNRNTFPGRHARRNRIACPWEIALACTLRRVNMQR